MSIGDSHVRSNDNTCTTIVVPTSAPKIIASAAAPPIKPRPAKDDKIRVVAVELCKTVVTANPTPNPWIGLPADIASMRRSSAPNERMTPVRTIRMPQSISATPPKILIKISTKLLFPFNTYAPGNVDYCLIMPERLREYPHLNHQCSVTIEMPLLRIHV